MAGRELPHRNERRPALGSARARLAQQGLAAAVVAIAAFACYHATLLPGLDFGDTGSFQTKVGSIVLTPRDAYPLYYALGNLFARLVPGEPAHAMNFASAVYGALAAGVLTLVVEQIAESVLAGAAAGFLLAFSYTFWTQAIIAEVYTLHLLITGVCLLALLSWERKPTLRRLAVFYAIYAVGFGNHLSMVLLLPAFTIFILSTRRRGMRDDPVAPRAIALACVIALAGSLQYLWNFSGLWTLDPPPANLAQALAKFWFDVTKSDWRETLVMQVSQSGMQNRPSMYWFDLHQQFGLAGVLLAIAGFVFTLAKRPRIALLLALMFVVNAAFAWTYNVGDVHVFFLPSHYVVALCAGLGVAGIIAGLRRAPAAASIAAVLVCLAYPIWRGYDTFPAVDRSWDHRVEQLLDEFTRPPGSSTVFGREAAYGFDQNWQIQNAVEYFMRERRPGVPWFTRDDILMKTVALDREIIVSPQIYRLLRDLGYTNGARAADSEFLESYGRHLLFSEVERLRPDNMYVLTVLLPYREYPADAQDLRRAWERLTGGTVTLPDLSNYFVAIGRVGQKPILMRASDRPFRQRLTIDGAAFDVRMESWLPTDTIRRAGFGHLIVNRVHTLTFDRGISFVALGPLNRPEFTSYHAGLFEPIPRLIPGTSHERQ